MLKVLRIYLAMRMSHYSKLKWYSNSEEPCFFLVDDAGAVACSNNRGFAVSIPVYGVYPLAGVWEIIFPWDDYKIIPPGSDYYPTLVAEIRGIVGEWVDNAIDDLLCNKDICGVASIEARGNYLRSREKIEEL